MTIIFDDDFRTGNLIAWTGSGNDGFGSSIVVSSSNPYSGIYSAYVNVVAGVSRWASAYKLLGSTYTTIHMRVYFYWSSGFPAINDGEGIKIFSLGNTGIVGGEAYVIIYNDNGTYKWAIRTYNNFGVWANTVSTSSNHPTQGGYYCLELAISPSSETLYLNDNSIISASITLNSGQEKYAYIGNSYNGANANAFYVADVVVADTYIGPSITKTKTSQIDVLLNKTSKTKTYGNDVLFNELEITKMDNIDVLLKKFGVTITNSIDAILYGKPITVPLPYNIDVFIRNLITTTTNTYNIDTLFNAPYRYNIDANLKLFGITKTALTDVDFEKLGVPQTYLIDTILSKAKQYSIDILLKMLGVPVQYAIDITFEKYGVPVQYIIDSRFITTLTSTYAIDMLLGKINIPVLCLTDALFKKLVIPTSIGVDTTLLSIIPPIYIQPTLMFYNPNGQLFCFPLTWKETQDCTPAIRQVPLAESEYLDEDSYVLKPREIEVTFRLSDTEKDLLEKIYAFADTSGANDFTDIYLFYNHTDSDAGVHPKPPRIVKQYTWHHTAWLSNKDYKYEYAFQDGRYVRLWTVTLTINVQSFSGSSAREPDYQPFAWAVVLDGHKLAHIIDFARNDKHPPMIPNWVNQPAEVDSYIWNECVLDLAYTDRMSNDEKYLMDLTLQNHQLVYLEDYIHNIVGSVWVSSISAEYDSTNWKKPWKVDIELKANNSDINFTSTANLSITSWGVNAEGDRIGPDGLGTLYMDEVQTPLTLGEQIINGDFENDTTGWIFTSGNSHIESGIYHSPTHAVLTHSDGTGFYQNITPIAGSDITHITFWMSAPYGHATVYVDVGYTDDTYDTSTFASEDPNFANMAVPFNVNKTVNKLTFRSATDNPSYIDDVSLIKISSPIVVNGGVHVFYFFLPKIASGIYKWYIRSNAVIVGEDTSGIGSEYSLDIQNFDRESRVSILIFGNVDCSIIIEYIISE